MLCRNPITLKTLPFGCGQCIPCLANRRRVWTSRIMLETQSHEDNSFITLTYDNAHIPSNGSLDPLDMQLFWKRLRKAVYPRKLRYYQCGEYGDKTWRPHYHAIVFNYPSCATPWRKKHLRKQKKPCDCPNCDLIQRTWKKGFTDCGTATSDSASYVAGYVTKKMTKKDDPRLNGKYPEFQRTSTGIGRSALPYLFSTLFDEKIGESFLVDMDIPNAINMSGKTWPLGRYLKKKLREMLGLDLKTDFTRFLNELHTLQKTHLSLAKKGEASPSFRQYLIDSDEGKALRLIKVQKQKQLRKTL